MVSAAFKSFLVQIITSWQVLGVTLVLIVYFSLVFYVARFRRKPKVTAASKSKPKPKKEKKAPPQSEAKAE
ncbi:MAG: hypothetical protein LBQ30_05320 [Treponema sp.]|jgi:heme/copper-type cytochrome/quinol oxidase subunit 2|nr:hypothetical protein [Treponema sp.]